MENFCFERYNDKKIKEVRNDLIVYYCCPMTGRKVEDVFNQISKDYTQIKDYFTKEKGIPRDNISVVHNFNAELPKNNGDYVNQGIAYLGKALLDHMSEADVVVFGEGWKASKGCQAEHAICEIYGLPTFYVAKYNINAT